MFQGQSYLAIFVAFVKLTPGIVVAVTSLNHPKHSQKQIVSPVKVSNEIVITK